MCLLYNAGKRIIPLNWDVLLTGIDVKNSDYPDAIVTKQIGELITLVRTNEIRSIFPEKNL